MDEAELLADLDCVERVVFDRGHQDLAQGPRQGLAATDPGTDSGPAPIVAGLAGKTEVVSCHLDVGLVGHRRAPLEKNDGVRPGDVTDARGIVGRSRSRAAAASSARRSTRY